MKTLKPGNMRTHRLSLEAALARQVAGVSTASGWETRRCNLDDVEEEFGEEFVVQAGSLHSCTFMDEQQ